MSDLTLMYAFLSAQPEPECIRWLRNVLVPHGSAPHPHPHSQSCLFHWAESPCARHCGAQVLSCPSHPFFQINIEDLEDDLVVNVERSDCTPPDSAPSGNKGRAKHGNPETKQDGGAAKAGSPEQVQRASPMRAMEACWRESPGCWPRPPCVTNFLNSSEFKSIHCLVALRNLPRWGFCRNWKTSGYISESTCLFGVCLCLMRACIW